ncbi:MAG: ArsR/SmtB family transcription factor [Candidatus Thorarchaeota archaeon]
MVEHNLHLNSVFSSLSDPTRRDILKRVADNELSISDIAKMYDLTFAAVSKHLKVLEKASLISKHRKGKKFLVHLVPHAFKEASDYLSYYQKFWEDKLDSLGKYLDKSE